MWGELMAAACLALVLEGLFLFAAPRAWRQAMVQLVRLDEQRLRRIGGLVLVAALTGLWLVRGPG
ncbi:DUF2065 family protein [Lysobacter sp. GX 14042]|uniref:DUF2065 domain-containing protein n=1 Tax=Lysobacter sp. GX 14042 TaxID=2907155 RepID=UPI001F1BA68B|nr:DUF2065 family protein [Lysobacter sp. GX 14042]MCE7032565.1 DUF2065 family protein [Lysobacter sp. GX 14042]